MDPFGLAFIVTAFLGLLVYWFLVSNFDYWRKRGVDGPKPKPLLGNMPSTITQKRNVLYDLEDLYREYKNKERFVGIFTSRSPQLLIIDPKLVQEVYVTKFKSFHDNEFSKWINKDIDKIFGRNPFFLTGQEWKEKRAEISPALTTNRIKASYPIMQQVCKKMMDFVEKQQLNPNVDGINARDMAANYTIEVVSNCIYGIEANAFSEGECKIRDMGTKIFDQSFSLLVYLMAVRMVPQIFNIWKKPIARQGIMDFFTELMDKAVRLRKENQNDRVDFLNYLLQLQEKKNLSSVDLAAHTMTFFLDGFETSSVFISNTLHLLANNQNVQEKLRTAIKSVAETDGSLSFEKLLELPYLEQCVNESLRIRPPAGFSSKLSAEQCEIRNAKDKVIQLEAGTAIKIPIYSIHHDPDYYPNPETFDPERFNVENGGVKKYKDMGVWLPFGDGPRTCLGMRFALCQSKAAIADLIRSWKVTVNPKTKDEFLLAPNQFFTVPDGGIWLDFQKI